MQNADTFISMNNRLSDRTHESESVSNFPHFLSSHQMQIRSASFSDPDCTLEIPGLITNKKFSAALKIKQK